MAEAAEATMPLDNDTRGWILTCVSGVACILGSAVVCVDLVVRFVPRWKGFRIQDSDAFLSSSLSLSFGVMLFSAIYTMLPVAKSYLIRGDLSASAASFTLIGSFLGGVVGIQLISGLAHHFMPSNIVGCDHTHDEPVVHEAEHSEEDDDNQVNTSTNGLHSEQTPLLQRDDYHDHPKRQRSQSFGAASLDGDTVPNGTRKRQQRPLMHTTLSKRLISLLTGNKVKCGDGGPCYGYSDLCGSECFKALSRAYPTAPLKRSSTMPHQALVIPPPGIKDSQVALIQHSVDGQGDSVFEAGTRLEAAAAEDSHSGSPSSPSALSPLAEDGEAGTDVESEGRSHMHHRHTLTRSNTSTSLAQHHHHVPQNAFLSIGLQTSLAIALHKLPEGFITFATNHANPRLGFAVFVALFIHNITEGFALALPLYLALQSRFKAIAWSSLLGGASQPLGAGIAALWFKLAQGRELQPDERAYGVMFAVTAGIMTSVALQLFAESLSLTHRKGVCITFAVIGMGILGFASALTA